MQESKTLTNLGKYPAILMLISSPSQVSFPFLSKRVTKLLYISACIYGGSAFKVSLNVWIRQDKLSSHYVNPRCTNSKEGWYVSCLLRYDLSWYTPDPFPDKKLDFEV